VKLKQAILALGGQTKLQICLFLKFKNTKIADFCVVFDNNDVF